MKTCTEIAEGVLRRRDEFMMRRKRRLRAAAGASVTACVLAALICVPRAAPGNGVSVCPEVHPQDGQADPSVDCVITRDPGLADDLPEDPGPQGNVSVITGYGDMPGASTCYAAPGPGDTGMSVPLREALKVFDDDAVYRTVADVFVFDGDGTLLEAAGDTVPPQVEADLERLNSQGLVVHAAVETHSGRSVVVIEATARQMEDLCSGTQLGYMLYLFDERIPAEDR